MADPIKSQTDERFAALEAENLTFRQAIASLERGVRNFKPIPLNRPDNAGLRAVVTSVDAVQEPFIRPRHNTYPGPRETRLSELGESREKASA